MTERYKLFIGGLPPYMNIEEIEASLSSLVPISQVEFLNPREQGQRKQSAGSYTHKSQQTEYCIVTVTDRLFYNRLIQVNNLSLGGRALVISPYLNGIDLYKANAFNNKRRVVLKGVPSDMQIASLVELIQWKFGQVENMFPFRKSTSIITANELAITSFSIMFVDVKAANLAASAGYLDIDKRTSCVIEKFRHSKIKAEKERRQHTIGHYDLHNHTKTHQFYSTRPIPYTDSTHYGYGYKSYMPQGNRFDIRHDQRVNIFFSPKNISSTNINGFSGNRAVKLKPNQRRYWCSGDFDRAYAHERQNLRFNL